MEKYGGLKEKKVGVKAALYPPGATMIGQEAGAPFISASGVKVGQKTRLTHLALRSGISQ